MLFDHYVILLAHTLPGGSSAIGGFLHPLLGIDHLLAMVTVGLLSAQMGGRAIWTVPATFVAVMAVGGVLGYIGVELPMVEYGIAASVIILGVALLAKRQIPVPLVMAIVGLFGLFHGHAHGAELPQVANDPLYVIAYVLGFMTATAGLHVIGALIGYILLRRPRGATMLRVAGIAIAIAGIFIITGI